ncbi:anti-sigma factor [Leifsonia sp. LS-T14]|uniref:anti-sigma factor n=1 Tax=unclassified Leifsonia TaxID=2663824 RepID=UPI0035A704D1
MTHSDPDVLAMLALGDTDVGDADLDHVMTCPECRTELERLTRVTRVARENGPVDFALHEPSPQVWERIRAQLTMDPSPAIDAATAPQSPPAIRETAAHPSRVRRRRRWPVVVSAVAVLAVAAVLALIVVIRPAAQPQVQAQVQAQATLAGLPTWSTSAGTATMEREPDGSTVLAVKLSSPAVHSGSTDYREVWLMNTELTKSISVGLLDGGNGRFVMPPNIAAADYPVVDISQQPLNGDPAHSGNSIVRGTLEPTG